MNLPIRFGESQFTETKHRVFEANPLHNQFVGKGRLMGPNKRERIWIDKAGALYQKRPYVDQFVPVGQLDTQGNFAFKNGFSGNIFNNFFFTVWPFGLNGPLGLKLQEVKRQISERSDEGPTIHKKLTQYGVDGRGIRARAIESGDVDDEGKLTLSDHTRAVIGTVNDPVHGYAPQAKMDALSFHEFDFYIEDDYASLIQQVEQYYVDIIGNIASRIQQSTDEVPYGLRVINISYGLGVVEPISAIADELGKQDNQGEYLYPNLREYLYGQKEPLYETREIYQRLFNQLTPIIKNSPVIKKALDEYKDTCKQAAEKGLTVVVAAGNEHDDMPIGVEFPPGAEMNFLSQNEHVIAVAASNNNMTPDHLADDWPTHFSSRGFGDGANPTLAATGENTYLEHYYYSGLPDGAFDGTSFACPHVVGAITLMLQANPKLSFKEIKEILTQSAQKVPYPEYAVGAGILNPEGAVQLALKKKQEALAKTQPYLNPTVTNAPPPLVLDPIAIPSAGQTQRPGQSPA